MTLILRICIFMSICSFFLCATIAAKEVKKGETMVLPEKLNSETMKPILQKAQKILKEQIGFDRFQDYFVVRVFSLNAAVRITFEFPLKYDNSNLTTLVGVTFSDGKVQAYPGGKQNYAVLDTTMQKIVDLFPPQINRSVYLSETSEYFEIRHSTHSRSGYGEGAEAYRVDKKTFEKKMIWHERPPTQTREPENKLESKIGNSPVDKDWDEVYFEVMKH